VTELGDAQRAVAELVADPDARAAHRADPAAYAARRLGPGPARDLLGGLDPQRVEATAHFGSWKLGLPPVATDADVLPWEAPATEPVTHRWLVGLGYRPELLPSLWRTLRDVEVWEHTVDRYLEGWPAGRDDLARLADQGPLSLHSVHLSVGSAACSEHGERVDAIAQLCRAAGVSELSDHLAYTMVDELMIGDFLPLWRTEEQLELAVTNVHWLQDRLGVRMAFENASVYYDPGGDLSWAEFSNELTRRTGCGLLLDLTNLLLNEANGLPGAGRAFLDELDLDAVTGVHLAGGEEDGGAWVDSHQQPIPATDLELLEEVLPRLVNCRSIIIERDDRYEAGHEVAEDLGRLRAVVARVQEAESASSSKSG
jgi:uncharacterized protein (UPF0276 family)